MSGGLSPRFPNWAAGPFWLPPGAWFCGRERAGIVGVLALLGIASAVAARAKCTRRRVGAVLTIDHRIIATGYNGAAPGEDDCLMGACPRGRLSYDDVPGLGDYDRPGTAGFCIAIHAEVNALLFATRDTKGAITRFADLFPQDVQRDVPAQLAMSLRAILSQRLLPDVERGANRHVALGVHCNTYPIASSNRLRNV